MSLIHQPQEIIRDKYRITGVLGKGGVAITYSAVNHETNFPVAIKVISLRQLNDWKQIELFQREAEVLKKLNYPAIPQYIYYFDRETETDKAFYLVQQLAPGKSLAQLVESGWRTSEREVKNIAQQVLAILTYLHSLDPPVIHRDIKPSNLIRDNDGKIYLVDFGAVQNTYYNTLMQGSTIVGTYGYMAPEQFRGTALPATDLYSLGATLLYLLTHRSPAELPQDTLKLDFRNSVDISESFADWLDKILEPDLEDRFSSADVALTELFKSEKKKQRKLVRKVGAIALTLGLFAGINSYKWFFLSSLGFYPANICNLNVWQSFFNQGGNINFINTKEIVVVQNSSHTQPCTLKNAIKNTNYYSGLLLLELSADVNIRDETGRTFLSNAAYYGHINIVKTLIKHNAEINTKSKHMHTPLSNAANKGHKNIVELLIKHGADVNVTHDGYGSNIAFDDAVTYSNSPDSIKLDIVEILIKNGLKVNAKDKRGGTIFFSTVYYDSVDIVQYLIKNGAEINVRDKSGRTPLFSVRSIDVAKLLIQHGAEVNVEDKTGASPLSMAIVQRDKNRVQFLIDNGADTKDYLNHMTIKRIYGLTPQHSKKIEQFLFDNKFKTKISN